MNTVAHTMASKLFVAFVAVAMLFTLATPAKAATAEELQQMINDLLAQVASLQGQTGNEAGVRSMCPYTWTRSLKAGTTGADVMKLQQFLNSDTDTRVSMSGVGSVGAETEYFGPATAAAVSKFQVKYRSDVLSPAGLVNPTGFFGPGSMGKANALCVQGGTTPTPDDSDDDSDDSDDSDDTDSDDLQGEASLDTFKSNDGDDTELEEGQEDAPVAEFDVEFSDGDAMITRIDVVLDKDAADTTGENDPWDTFEEVTLWVDGDKVASMDASDEDEYLDEDDGSLRFSGLDIVAMEDEEITITVSVTVQGSVDGTSAGEDWEVNVDAMRFLDGDDVSTTETSYQDIGADGVVDFSIDEKGVDDELVVKSSSEDPDATTLQLEDDSKSDYMTVFAYTLDTDDSVNDIVIENLVLSATTSVGQNYNALVSDAKLMIDGEEYDDVTVTNGASSTLNATLNFDIDGDLTIEAGDEVTVELMLEFKQLATTSEGATISASTNGSNNVAEGADDLDNTAPDQLTGSATGETHTLRTEGAILKYSSQTGVIKVNSTIDVADDEGVYTLKFDVTAFENDLYIDDLAVRGTTLGTEGANFTITSGGLVSATGTAVATLDSSAKLEGTRFKVAEGETKTFTLTVEFDPLATGAFKVQLHSLNFANTNAFPTTQQLALPLEDFDTESLTI